MPRYIDAEELKDKIRHKGVFLNTIGSFATERDIDEIPTADVQEVVRCKDCKYCHTQNCEPRDIYLCNQRWSYTEETDPDGFCHRGKRKEVARNDL